VVVPALIATNTIFFMLHSQPGERAFILVAAILGLMLPFVFEIVGVFPPSYAFSAGQMIIQPRVLALPESRVPVLLTVMHLMLAIAPALIAFRVRDDLLAAQRKLHLTSWRLGQLAADLHGEGGAPRDGEAGMVGPGGAGWGS
jgi:hypothetical protein